MESYLLFLVIAAITVVSPGPGVILTLTNTIRFGMSGAVGGILGIACGTFIVAGVSATSLGVLLATSSVAFTIMKYVGAAYLIYLGIKLWRTPVEEIDVASATLKSKKLQFLEGLILQVTNPKAVFFFMSIFPQFIDFGTNATEQFVLLVVSYSLLVIAIHFLYSIIAKKARRWFSSQKGGRSMNRVGGTTFIGFGIGLASANK
ncbi:MAG: LysE family translocator [Arenicella sp.]